MLDVSCRGYKTDNAGLVVGVELEVIELKNALFTVGTCSLINEREAQGKITAYNNFRAGDNPNNEYKVALCYPISRDGRFQNILLPGNSRNEHPIINSYNPTGKGFLSLCVIDKDKKVVSDILYGLGLPFNRHVGFNVVWEKKDTPIDPSDDPIKKAIKMLLEIEGDLDNITVSVEHTRKKVFELRKSLGGA